MGVSATRVVHQNPVYGSYFADPFVWRHQGTYYAIGTGESEACGSTLGKVFPLLQSADFFQWTFASSALTRPARELGNHFWAPEVAVVGSEFFLYYSVGHEDKHHQLRVAVASAAQGPYRDLQSLGVKTETPFAIDPHPFQDDDGMWYIFYATDFLDSSEGHRVGTGLMVSLLENMISASGPSSLVLRSRHDWQRFQNPRALYGGVWDWHTLEGPFVVKRGGKYYCFYSGGRWETSEYDVDYAVADSVLGPWDDSGAETGPRVLRTVPGYVLGPGHNSIVTGPDGETDYIVYHAWDAAMRARQMFIDKLTWTPDGPRCEGPTWSAAFEHGTTKTPPATIA